VAEGEKGRKGERAAGERRSERAGHGETSRSVYCERARTNERTQKEDGEREKEVHFPNNAPGFNRASGRLVLVSPLVPSFLLRHLPCSSPPCHPLGRL